MKCEAILLAGGKGLRLGGAIPKQYLMLGQETIAMHSFRALENCPEIDAIVVVAEEPYHSLFTSSKKTISYALPGIRRQDSMKNGLNQVSAACTHALIHDAARPFLTPDLIKSVIVEGFHVGAATLAVLMKATIKQADSSGIVQKTLDRSCLYEIQTPQVVRVDWLKSGLEIAEKQSLTITDDVGLAELQGFPVKLVAGSSDNFKITTPEDLRLAYALLEVKSGAL
jgi:2-C-methyl-D-erythritol 4-phosphate cytidylyltransferase